MTRPVKQFYTVCGEANERQGFSTKEKAYQYALKQFTRVAGWCRVYAIEPSTHEGFDSTHSLLYQFRNNTIQPKITSEAQ